MNVTVVDCDLSYPPTSGKRLRTLHLLLPLASRHRITYLGRSDGDQDAERQAGEYLRDHGIEPLFVRHRVPAKSGWGVYGRLLANLLSPLPYAAVAFNSRNLTRTIQDHVARGGTDLWQFEWLPYVAAFPSRSGRPAVLNAHNVDSQIWQRYAGTTRSPWKKWFFRQQWKKQESLERNLLPRYRAVVAVSQPDADTFSQRLGVSDVAVVDNGIDAAQFQSVPTVHDPHRVLFLGLLDYRPNRDAVELLLSRVFPRVLSAEPRARLSIVGRNPPDDLVRRISHLPEVALHANVADVRPYLTGNGVMAVPLRVGGGSRLKILEAIASGLPVVSTALGAEGLHLGPDEGVQIVEDADQMAGALVQFMRSPTMLSAAAQRGRQIVLQRHAWDVLAERLEAVWIRCLSGRTGESTNAREESARR
jgi:glycosyltransferase involved in cell wall biosynthesis